MKVLILKPSSLGDVIHALPVLRQLKRHHPAAEVFWWIASGLAPLLEADPDLSGLIHFDRRRWGRLRHWPELLGSIRSVRADRFDVVVDLQGLARSGLFAWLANAPLTIGLEDRREGASAFYDIAVPRPSDHTHAVDWYLQVLPHLGVPHGGRFDWIPERPEVQASVRRRWPAHRSPWILLLPGARWPNKRWPQERFAAVTRRLASRLPSAGFVVLGGPEDQPSGRLIGAAAPEATLDLTGRTSLPEMVEWIRRADVVLSNDTGPMHVAAALRRPVVALFGPTDPRRTGPYGQEEEVLRHDLPCVPCMKDRCTWHRPLECLHRLEVEAVARRVMERLPAGSG